MKIAISQLYLFTSAQNIIITIKVKAFTNANNDLVYQLESFDEVEFNEYKNSNTSTDFSPNDTMPNIQQILLSGINKHY